MNIFGFWVVVCCRELLKDYRGGYRSGTASSLSSIPVSHPDGYLRLVPTTCNFINGFAG